MGKLNIAHHKSYHPYRRDNIERVRKDEEEARLQQLKDEGRLMMADSEARIDQLRKKASGGKSRRRSLSPPTETLVQPEDSLTTPTGHINFFTSAESQSSASTSAVALAKKMKDKEAERGFALAPSKKDLQPWYAGGSSSKDKPLTGDDEEDSKIQYKAKRRERNEAELKIMNDPLTAMNAYLSKKAKSTSSFKPPLPKEKPPQPSASTLLVDDRLSRESSERARAEALIARKRREAVMGSDAASSIGGDTPRSYGDVYNRKETADAAERRKGDHFPSRSSRSDTGERRGDPRYRRW